MAYDEELADRIRALIAGSPRVSERKMFGGLAFLIDGHMAVVASGQGGMMARVDPQEGDSLVSEPHVEPMEMGGRSMRGWLRVDIDAVRTKHSLESWVNRSVTYARTLPPK